MLLKISSVGIVAVLLASTAIVSAHPHDDGISKLFERDSDDPELCCSGIPPSYSLCCTASCGVCESVSCDVRAKQCSLPSFVCITWTSES